MKNKTQKTTIKAIGYLRSAQMSQKSNNASLSIQRKLIADYAQENGWILVGFHAEVAKNQSSFIKFVKDSKSQNYQVVVATAYDRFGRNIGQVAKGREILADKGILMTTTRESYPAPFIIYSILD